MRSVGTMLRRTWCLLAFAAAFFFQCETAAQELRAVTVPWLGDPTEFHEVYPGGTLILQGTARVPDGCVIEEATWDPGDGSGPQQVADVRNPRVLELSHTYNDNPNTLREATLFVRDSCGNTATDTFRVAIGVRTLRLDVNMAIDRGLWTLHKNMTLASVGEVETGVWSDAVRAGPASTASAVLAMEVHGHLESGDPDEDPYVDDVARGLAHLTSVLTPLAISPQTAGNPDGNGNGIGLTVAARDPVYIIGQIVDAFVATKTPLVTARTGDANAVLDQTYATIVQDLMDSYSFGQFDSTPGRGGWRYVWNVARDGDGADNSACQWAAIAGLAIERSNDPDDADDSDEFAPHVSIPEFVKDENRRWLRASQVFNGSGTGADGRFGYTNSAHIDVNGMNTTPSGLIQLIFDGPGDDDTFEFDGRFQAAEKFMVRQWSQLLNNDRLYGMFAVAKAARLADPPITRLDGRFDWYLSDTEAGDPVDGLARYLVRKELPSGAPTGQWTGSRWVPSGTYPNLATAWALIILSSTIIEPPPVAVCDAEPERTGRSEDDPPAEVTFDASRSFHQDPNKKLVIYRLDFEGDGTFDFEGEFDDDPGTPERVTHGYTDYGTFEVELQVEDEDGNTDGDTCCVEIVPPPIPPSSDPNGPYVFCIGTNEPFTLDGTGSDDPDGEIVAYGWDYRPVPLDDSFDDATTPTVDVTEYYTQLGPGNYIVGLRVTSDYDGPEDDLRFDTDFTTVTVIGPGQPCDVTSPTCIIRGAGPLECQGAITRIQLDGSESFDPDQENDPPTHLWSSKCPGASFDDPTSSSPILSVDTSCACPISCDVMLTVTDEDGNSASCVEAITIPECPPIDCSNATPSVSECWPPNHKFVLVEVEGVTTGEGSAASITIDAVTQDELATQTGTGSGMTCPDAVLVDTDGDGNPDAAGVRCEREGRGNGRVYRIHFTATDESGSGCEGTVFFCVPHDQGRGNFCVDDGHLFDSIVAECPSSSGNGRGASLPDVSVINLTEFESLTPEPLFLRGDVDWDEKIQITDGIFILDRLFRDDKGIDCPDAADVNDDGNVDLTDGIDLFWYLFLGGHAPRGPHLQIGNDPTEDGLGCELQVY